MPWTAGSPRRSWTPGSGRYASSTSGRTASKWPSLISFSVSTSSSTTSTPCGPPSPSWPGRAPIWCSPSTAPRRSPPRRPRRRRRPSPPPTSTHATASRPSWSAPPISSPRRPASPWPRPRRAPTTRCSSTGAWAWARRTSCRPSAIASAQSHDRLRIQYLSTEKFTNELIAAIRYDRTPEFRQRYRTIDLLLIDDIQFLSGKERTQEEFFHTFNDLYDSHRQIVLSSDRSPKEIPEIEERLRSRFEWGLIADIQPPDFETRVAILKKKAELDRVALPDDVAYFIANRVKSNIRELEGSLVRIRAFCNLTGRPLTLDLAQEVLANIWGAEERLVTIDDILRRVGEVFHVKTQDLRAKTRTRAVAFPRQVAMYLARQLTSDSYADIGRGFGGKDHTTVLHAVNKIEALLQQDPKFRRTLDHIINTIRVA